MKISVEDKIKDKTNDKVLKLKSFIEEMELQFSLGKSELIDELQSQKNNLKIFINEQKEHIQLAEKNSEMKGFLEELELQLALGKAETRDIFEEQKNNIIKQINSIEEIINLHEKSIEHKEKVFFKLFMFKAYKLRTTMEILKSEFNFEKSKLKERIDATKKDISGKLHLIKLELDSDVDILKKDFDSINYSVKSIFTSFFAGLTHSSPLSETHEINKSEAEMENQRNSVEERNAKHQDIVNAKRDKHV